MSHSYWQRGLDPLRQLTETFTYDPVGNRTASHLATGQLYDAANRLLEDSAFTYQYDRNGNLTTRTARATGATTTYTYDVENRLVAVTGPGLTASYAYDPLGRRIAKTVNGVVTRSVYDQEDLLVEYDGGGTPRIRYTHGPGIDEPLARADIVTGQTAYYHADGLGSITELTDGTGAVVQRYSYDAFGAILASPGTVAQPYTFTAREFDLEAALYYYRARYYDSNVGRFLQEDPIGLAGGVNLYLYVHDNPISQTDPLGLFSIFFPIPAQPLGAPTRSGTCLGSVLSETEPTFARGTGDKYKHCVVSCKIFLKCGALSANAAGIGKEVLDIFGPGNAEWADLVADYKGVECGRAIKAQKSPCDRRTCKSCCRAAYP